jgi:D-sedoheptulose 7-phosphate isomerase
VDGKARSAKALLLGNGGSAAIVSHVHNDLMKAVGMRAVVFNEAALLTALTNDDGYETAFETLISKWIEPGDLVIAVSSSGRSANIVRAVQRARGTECFILSFTGFRPDNPLRALGSLNFYVPSESYGYVEMAHAVLLHYLTDSAMARGK